MYSVQCFFVSKFVLFAIVVIFPNLRLYPYPFGNTENDLKNMDCVRL